MAVDLAPAQMNGISAPTYAEDEDLYAQLLRLQDVVLAGQHPNLRLSPSAAAKLKAALIVPDLAAHHSAYATNQQQLQSSSTIPKADVLPGLPGLAAPGTRPTNGAKPQSAELDPIFLEKSDSLVRAEGQLKRQRIERDLQVQVEQRKHTARDKDISADGPSRIDTDAVLTAALELVPPISGLKPAKAASTSSFDENDYYSSLVQSDWSSEASSSKGSDKGVGAFTADFERLDEPPASLAQSSAKAQKRSTHTSALSSNPAKDRPVYIDEDDDVYEPEIEDDEYTPPEAAAFDSYRGDNTAMEIQQVTPPEDDNSDYEPGEITQESAVPTPRYQPYQTVQPSPHVTVIRNDLTHIAAPQPNRVSQLTTAKGPSIELELVNGRPEVVQKPRPQHRAHAVYSRASTASPSGNTAGGAGGKNRRKKKRKQREHELNNKPAKRRRERQAAAQSPVSPIHPEPYIKPEPISPPPFDNVPQAPAYQQTYPGLPPAQIDLSSPGYAPQRPYVNEPARQAVRYEYPPPTSPASYQPIRRDNQDLRRVASLHYAQRPVSPAHRTYSPVAPYRSASLAYPGHGPMQLAPASDVGPANTYHATPTRSEVQYVRAPSPPRQSEYEDPYISRAQSPAPVAAPPPRQIFEDQYGKRYYLAEVPPAPSRASVAPVEVRAGLPPAYERAPTRMGTAHPPPPPTHYEPVSSHMAPPPPAGRRQERPPEYLDTDGYRARDYSTRPPEAARYAEAPTSPAHQHASRYEEMPPPPAPATRERTSPVYQEVRYEQMAPPPLPPAREPTSPVYAQVSRAYSMRPEEAPQPIPSYIRQASLAPAQYAQPNMAPPQPPARAISVMPGVEYGTAVPQPTYSYAPQAVKYVDQYGREVYPQPARQVSEYRYQ